MIERREFMHGLAAATASTLAAPRLALAQAASSPTAWPTQTVKFVVPFTPGGSTDLLARVIGRQLEPILGQPIVIENRPGAGGSVAAGQVAKADDNHTFMMGHIGTLAFNVGLYALLPYDPVTSFAPVAMVAIVPNILVVHPDVPAKTVLEFIAHAKANPGKLNYGSGGNGSAAHIATAYFGWKTGTKLVHVPYRGTSPAVNDLVGGHIQFMMTGGPATLPLVAAGKLRAISVSSRNRAPFAPDLPTVIESGLPDFVADQWYGLVAPASTRPDAIRRLNAEINKLMGAKEVVDNLNNDGAIATPMTPEAFGDFIKSELTLWRDVIRQAGISAT